MDKERTVQREAFESFLRGVVAGEGSMVRKGVEKRRAKLWSKLWSKLWPKLWEAFKRRVLHTG